MLDTSYRAAQVNPEAFKPQQLVQGAIRLNNIVGMDTASAYAVAVKKAQDTGQPVTAQADLLIEGVNAVIAEVNAATAGIPRNTKEGQALIARIQEKALNEFKINVSFATLPEIERSSPLAKGDATMVQLIDAIIGDIQKQEQGNKGKFYITGGKAKAQRAQETLFTTGGTDAVPIGQEVTDPDKTPPPEVAAFNFDNFPKRSDKGKVTTGYKRFVREYPEADQKKFMQAYNDLKAKEPKKFKEGEGVRTDRKTITDEWNKWNKQFEPYDEFYNDLQVYKLTQ